MSSNEYAPGTVAVATFCDDLNVRVSRYGHGWARLADPDDYINDEDLYGDGGHRVTDIRPLVVIDPEDREDVERLHTLWCQAIVSKGTSSRQIDSMQAALREFANPTPPEPVEPTGLGAVVEDAEGRRWVRDEGPGRETRVWYRRGVASCRHYADIAAVRVLSEGVQP